MTEFPGRGQRAPQFWDLQLKAYIDERDAAAQCVARVSRQAERGGGNVAGYAVDARGGFRQQAFEQCLVAGHADEAPFRGGIVRSAHEQGQPAIRHVTQKFFDEGQAEESGGASDEEMRSLQRLSDT